MGTWEDLDKWRLETLADWTDKRIVDVETMDIWIWFFEHLYADLVNFQWELAKFSFRQKDLDWLLVAGFDTPEGPQVVFLSSSTPTRCMRKLRSQLRSGELKSYPDKYA